MPLDTSSPRGTPSPLWIIALFIGLSEAMAALASVGTSGTARLIFAIFATSFPVIVLLVFVWLLLKHPANLYSPGQYTEITPLVDFVRVLSASATDRDLVIKQAIAGGVAEVVQSEQSGEHLIDTETLRERIAAKIESIVDESSVTVERSLILDNAQPVQIPVSADTRVDSFLDSIYFAISPAVKPFTYGQSWILTDEDMNPVKNIGTRWARKHGEKRDSRLLTEVGIKPGARMWAIPHGGRRSGSV